MLAPRSPVRAAFRFVLLIGIVNLFADFTYEGGRSIMGPFLGALGATGTIVGLVAGLGEFLGYGLRSVSGYLADRTHKYWVAAGIGYVINMLAVPALALAGSWPAAAALLVLERTGRAIRRPAVETMLSYAAKDLGRGRVFGFNEALDQAGATAGPLLVALVLYLGGGYRRGFALLLIPAVLCLASVALARALHPRPQELDRRVTLLPEARGFRRSYWVAFAAGSLIAAGFADFALIAFHFRRAGSVPVGLVPVFYATAMAVGALSALVFGKAFDRVGVGAVVLAFFLSAFFAPLVFLGTAPVALAGMVLWGIGLGVQDSLLKALLAGLLPDGKRATGFGVFDTGFGVAWFAGSAVLGFLYDRSIPALIVVSVVLQLAALPLFFKVRESRA